MNQYKYIYILLSLLIFISSSCDLTNQSKNIKLSNSSKQSESTTVSDANSDPNNLIQPPIDLSLVDTVVILSPKNSSLGLGDIAPILDDILAGLSSDRRQDLTLAIKKLEDHENLDYQGRPTTAKSYVNTTPIEPFISTSPSEALRAMEHAGKRTKLFADQYTKQEFYNTLSQNPETFGASRVYNPKDFPQNWLVILYKGKYLQFINDLLTPTLSVRELEVVNSVAKTDDVGYFVPTGNLVGPEAQLKAFIKNFGDKYPTSYISSAYTDYIHNRNVIDYTGVASTDITTSSFALNHQIAIPIEYVVYNGQVMSKMALPKSPEFYQESFASVGLSGVYARDALAQNDIYLTMGRMAQIEPLPSQNGFITIFPRKKDAVTKIKLLDLDSKATFNGDNYWRTPIHSNFLKAILGNASNIEDLGHTVHNRYSITKEADGTYIVKLTIHQYVKPIEGQHPVDGPQNWNVGEFTIRIPPGTKEMYITRTSDDVLDPAIQEQQWLAEHPEFGQHAAEDMGHAGQLRAIAEVQRQQHKPTVAPPPSSLMTLAEAKGFSKTDEMDYSTYAFFVVAGALDKFSTKDPHFNALTDVPMEIGASGKPLLDEKNNPIANQNKCKEMNSALSALDNAFGAITLINAHVDELGFNPQPCTVLRHTQTKLGSFRQAVLNPAVSRNMIMKVLQNAACVDNKCENLAKLSLTPQEAARIVYLPKTFNSTTVLVSTLMHDGYLKYVALQDEAHGTLAGFIAWLTREGYLRRDRPYNVAKTNIRLTPQVVEQTIKELGIDFKDMPPNKNYYDIPDFSEADLPQTVPLQ